MIFSNFFVATKTNPGAFPGTQNDLKWWFEGLGTIQSWFWRSTKKSQKSIFWRLFMIFSNFFVATKIDPGTFPGTPNDSKRCFGGSGTIPDWFWGLPKKSQKSSFLTPKKSVVGIFFLATERTSEPDNKTEHYSRCVLKTWLTRSGRRWPDGAKNGPQRRTKKWSSRERPADFTSERRPDGTSGAVVFFVPILKRRSKRPAQGGETIVDGSGRFRPQKSDPER